MYMYSTYTHTYIYIYIAGHLLDPFWSSSVTKGLEEVRAELEQVRAELKEVRESRFNQSGLSRDSQRFEERFEDDNRCLWISPDISDRDKSAPGN